VAELNKLFSGFEDKASTAQLVQLKASKQFTLLIVDQLAPQQDCQALLASSTTKTN
jgi:hypothetical protein